MDRLGAGVVRTEGGGDATGTTWSMKSSSPYAFDLELLLFFVLVVVVVNTFLYDFNDPPACEPGTVWYSTKSDVNEAGVAQAVSVAAKVDVPPNRFDVDDGVEPKAEVTRSVSVPWALSKSMAVSPLFL